MKLSNEIRAVLLDNREHHLDEFYTHLKSRIDPKIADRAYQRSRRPYATHTKELLLADRVSQGRHRILISCLWSMRIEGDIEWDAKTRKLRLTIRGLEKCFVAGPQGSVTRPQVWAALRNAIRSGAVQIVLTSNGAV